MTTSKIRLCIVIISDRAHSGQRKDETGPKLIPLFPDDQFEILSTIVIPDDFDAIVKTLKVMSPHVDLILTSGGTGLTPRDVTPEATLSIAEKQVPGIAEFLRAQSFAQTRYAALSRGVAVILGKTLIINLPGSPKGSKEYTEWLLPLIPHAVRQVTGEWINDKDHSNQN